MAEVTRLETVVTTSAKEAADALDDLAEGLNDVAEASEKTSTATEETSEKFKGTANEVRNLAKALDRMGIKNQAKGVKDLAKDIDISQNLEKVRKNAEALAAVFEGKGQQDFADAIRESFEDPIASEKALVNEIKRAKAAEQQRLEDEKSNAAERAAIAKWEEQNKAAAIRKSVAIAKESEKAYTEITNGEASKRASKEADALKESARIAKEVAASDKAYREITNNAIIEAVRKREAEIAKINKQKQREDRIGSAALEKARKKIADDKAKAEADEAKAAKEAEKRIESAKKSIGKFGDSVSSPFKKISSMLRAIGRIALYRAIRTAIKSISAAVREGLTNLEAYSRTFGTAFAPAVDNLRKHVLLLKNAFATALRPILEALIPVVIRLADWFSKLADFAAQVFSVLTGKVDENGRYTKAVLGDLQQSNKEAKELRRTLLGFDEINRLDGDTGSGESASSGANFVQADVSEKALAVAEKLKPIIEKIKETINSIDWATVLKVIAVIWAVVQGIKLVQKLKKVFDAIKSIGTVLGGVSASTLAVIAVIALVIAAFALWGDKISTWCKNAKKDIRGFFTSLKTESTFFDALGDLISSTFGLALDIIGDLASAVYKLVHGDFRGAWEDLKMLFADILLGVAGILDAIINIVIGVAADIWNFALVPLINGIATVIAKIHVWVHNAWLDIQIGVLTAIAWIIEQLNKLLGSLETAINNAIAAWNKVMGTDIQPVKLTIDSANVDKKIEELENKKLPPITETVELAGKWNAPKVTLMTDLANQALDALGIKVNKLGTALASIIRATGQGGATNTISMYASGGFPSVGTMFIAGESGAEYVGDINGRTGVYNTDQMAAALYNAFTAALATMPQQGGDIYLDGEVIYRNTVRRNNNNFRATGRSALLT